MQISRLFHASADAQKAFDELKHAGFENARLIGGTGAAAGTDELRRHGITQESAAHLAERLSAGAALVIVESAVRLCAGSDEIARGSWDPPRTQARAWPVTRDCTALVAGQRSTVLPPRSAGRRCRTIRRRCRVCWVCLPLSRSQSPGATSHGFATLTHNPAPLSLGTGGLPTLTGKAAPLSSALGAFHLVI